MKLFDILGLQDPRVTLNNSKVHLAKHNGTDNPLRVYHQGVFDEWQSWQNKRNFPRPFVVSVIQMRESNQWLYVGTYAVGAVEWREDHKSYKYGLERLESCAEMAGRLLVYLEWANRAVYINAETVGEAMHIHEIQSKPIPLHEFPGFKKVDLEWPDLEVLVLRNTTSWRTALSSVAGVYLISDPIAGKLYVGSATGEGGIWARWSQYVDGHGNNVELLMLIGSEGRERARAFRFSILEIADVHASPAEVLERENHWKRVLMSRSCGYNSN